MNEYNERYFPKHKLEKEIGLAEYAHATDRLSNHDRAITWATNVLTFIATLIGLVAFKFKDLTNSAETFGLSILWVEAALLAFILSISFFAILHIANLLKSQTFAERKVIVLRRMLGVSYGENSLVLPNWRIEGADNPFAIRLFPGFWSYKSMPVYFILAGSAVSFLFIGQDIYSSFVDQKNGLTSFLENVLFGKFIVLATTLWVLFGVLVFRLQLREANENWRLWLTKLAASLSGVPLVRNFEQQIYHVRLTIAEMHRIRTDLKHAKTLAIAIEDKEFRRHHGINWRGTARAVYSRIAHGKRSGGSSITQQFARSNFITHLKPSLGRKIVEMLLARWIESIWDKTDILEAYLATVRFDRGVYGFHRGYRNLFDESATNVAKWEAFILIERLGNIRGLFLGRRVQEILAGLISSKELSQEDAEIALKFYEGCMGLHFKENKGDLVPAEVLANLSQSK